MENLEKRAQAFLKLSRFTGVEVTSQFLRQTEQHFPQAEVPCLHNLIEGIYKPAGDSYALCIWSRSAAGQDREIYHDVFSPQSDGSWTMQYAAKKGNLDAAVNRSLFACMRDKVPLIVIVTTRSQKSPGGSRYKILGPAIIEGFDSTSRRFFIRGCSTLVTFQIVQPENEEDAVGLSIRNQLIMPFQVREVRTEYVVKREVRERAFRKILLEEYRCLCAVCQSKFILKQKNDEPLIEAEAAHIISVQAKGPDDPRNGLSLCRRHHWSFDNGLFTVTDSNEIKVSPSVFQAKRRRFDLEEYEGESLVPPAHEICRPHEEALHWHQKNKYRSI